MREVLILLIVFNQEDEQRSDEEWLTEKKKKEKNLFNERCLCSFICDGMAAIVNDQRAFYLYDLLIYLHIIIFLNVIEVQISVVIYEINIS